MVQTRVQFVNMVTLALIGAGKWGQKFLHTVDSLDNCIIKYICAQSQKTLDSLPNKYTKITSVDKLLNYDIDGVIIASPASTHFEIAKKFLKQRFNLLIEKPLTTDYTQALELHKLWQTKKTKILVGHTYLYNPAYQTFKKLFGSIKRVRSIHFEGLASPVRKDVSVIWDWGPHPVSLILDLVKQPVVKVNASASIKNPNSNLYDTVNALINFANGIETSIHISWFGPHKVRRLTATGENGSIELDDTNTTNQKILLHQPNKPLKYPKYKPETALTNELIEFVAAIQGFKKITSDINMGIAVVRVLTAIEQSTMNGGQLVKLDPIFSS